jgi:hypothetical protein
MTGDEPKQRNKAVIHVVLDWQIQLWLRAIFGL